MEPRPSVVELNRAVAVAMADGPAHELRIIERLEASGALEGYLLPTCKGALLSDSDVAATRRRRTPPL